MPKLRIAPKQFARITDLQADYHRAGEAYVANRNPETLAALDKAEKELLDYEDSVGWPWRATQEQLDASLGD